MTGNMHSQYSELIELEVQISPEEHPKVTDA